tara:strand:- start:416 stop:766 length:351 start_codon:yes stop_codon:yes gene_type:complete
MFNITSNLLYLCAAVVAGAHRHWVWAVLMTGVTVCSVLYHIGALPRRWDVAMAVAAFAYGICWFVSTGIRNWAAPLFTAAMIACLAIPKPDQEAYDAIHPWAHVFGGLASITIASP